MSLILDNVREDAEDSPAPLASEKENTGRCAVFDQLDIWP
jgi:hypothetical protein